MEKPFFSIVIPTKNRPSLLKDAIQSVLWQNFNDFELLVSDNFNDKETQDVIASFKKHPNFRSIRTEQEMNMIDHWEWATKQATGKYVMVLADRKVLYQNALKKAYKTILRFPEINAFSVGVQTFDEVNGLFRWNHRIQKTSLYYTKSLLENFIKENLYGLKTLDTIFPKTLNGFYKNDFVISIRNEIGNYFNIPNVTTPDFSSCFVNLFANNQILHIGEKIILTQGETKSNGRIFGIGEYSNYFSSLKIKDPYLYTPIKAPFIYMLLINDFHIIKNSKKWNKELEIDQFNVFRTCYYEYLQKKELNPDSRNLSEFKNAILNSDLLKKDDLQTIINSTKIEFNSRFNFNRGLSIKLALDHLRDFLRLRFSENHLLNKIFHYKYKSALEAAKHRISR